MWPILSRTLYESKGLEFDDVRFLVLVAYDTLCSYVYVA
jgi:hypothetical protein